jgi:hypothetical protein
VIAGTAALGFMGEEKTHYPKIEKQKARPLRFLFFTTPCHSEWVKESIPDVESRLARNPYNAFFYESTSFRLAPFFFVTICR